MAKYRVTATRTTVYDVEADDREHAVDEMMEGMATAVDQTTERMDAEPLCPTCGDVLTTKTTRTVTADDETWVEATWCATCQHAV